MKDTIKNKIQNYVETNNICFNEYKEPLYETSAEVVLDAVLSINRKYYDFVVPRLIHIHKNYPNIKTLLDLSDLFKKETDFSLVWQYNHQERAAVLYRLVHKLLSFVKNIDNELIELRYWAQDASYTDFKNFCVFGIGIATFQYIRILLGADTVKPDVHIKRFVVDLCNVQHISDQIIVEPFDELGKENDISVRLLDKHIWSKYADKALAPKYKFINGVWVKKI